MEQPAEEERHTESMVGIPKETNASKIQLVPDRSSRTALRWNRDMQKWNLRKTSIAAGEKILCLAENGGDTVLCYRMGCWTILAHKVKRRITAVNGNRLGTGTVETRVKYL